MPYLLVHDTSILMPDYIRYTVYFADQVRAENLAHFQTTTETLTRRNFGFNILGSNTVEQTS